MAAFTPSKGIGTYCTKALTRHGDFFFQILNVNRYYNDGLGIL